MIRKKLNLANFVRYHHRNLSADARWLCIVFAKNQVWFPHWLTVSFGSGTTWDTRHMTLMPWDMILRLMVCSSTWLVQKLTLGQKAAGQIFKRSLTVWTHPSIKALLKRMLQDVKVLDIDNTPLRSSNICSLLWGEGDFLMSALGIPSECIASAPHSATWREWAPLVLPSLCKGWDLNEKVLCATWEDKAERGCGVVFR